ncbi:MAG: PspC domain-containing protein [Sphingobacteriales bacterium JAD_PAG50586_3]|nr:MAG: PspC domain-containing protein [Sphingobacteriales bacterium JAD_PAG50586_3]
MNKTVNINLGGLPFILDEPAYDKLHAYLQTLQRHFATTEGAGHEEIMADIEARVAEILTMKHSGNKKIVTMADVDEVITIIGKPEEMGAENGDAGSTGNSTYTSNDTFFRRRLYRDDDHSTIGGVCQALVPTLV